MRAVARSMVALVLMTSAPLAAADWFPPQFEESATHQLADRLVEVGVAEGKSDEERLEWSRGFVRHVVDRVDGWGLEGVLERTPELAEIEFPPTGDAILAAMAVFGACALPLHPELVETREEKVFVAMGEITVAIVSAYLRHHRLAAGGSDQEMATYLGSEAMNQLSYDVQVEEESRNYVVIQCGPMFEAVLE